MSFSRNELQNWRPEFRFLEHLFEQQSFHNLFNYVNYTTEMAVLGAGVSLHKIPGSDAIPLACHPRLQRYFPHHDTRHLADTFFR